MYLAFKEIKGMPHYFIRQSYPKDDHFLSRDLFYLGVDPGRYIVYPGGNAFYIDEVVLDGLSSQGITPKDEQLEHIFWRFLKPEIKRALEPFRRRELRVRQDRRTPARQEKSGFKVHIFDQRRLCYLKFGRLDMRNIGRMPSKIWRRFHQKSRDEIEQHFINMETILRPTEYKNYTYAIFDLQRLFNESFAKEIPEFLDAEKVDAYFLEEICHLNSDLSFWSGMATTDSLHEYMIRYILMYFDYDYAPRSFIEDYIRNFINSRRVYRPPYKCVSAMLDEASATFGEKKDNLKNMSRKSLARLYRRKAQQLHPDKGGDHEKFIKLSEIYHELLKRKQ